MLLRVAIVATLFTAAAPSLAQAATQCTKTLTGATLGSVVVPANGACNLKSSTVSGSVTVLGHAYFEATSTKISGAVTGKGAQTIFINTGSSTGAVSGLLHTAQVFVFNAAVNGPIQSVGGTSQAEVCGTTVAGQIEVQSLKGGPQREILIGDPAANCGADTATNVLVSSNVTNVFFGIIGNTISGNLTVSSNIGKSQKYVQHNNGGKTLDCTANASPFVGSPNGTWATKEGQCK